MLRKSIFKALGFAIVTIVLSTAVSAQTGQVEGTVKVNAEGAKKPVAGALVDIYRSDIKGHWSVKTDKSGHYILLGLPLQGTFLFVASGPGMTPTWVNNVRVTQTPVLDIVAEPGEGATMTLEQVQQAMAAQRSGGGGAQPAQRTVSPADKAKYEAAQKEQDSKRKEAEALQSNFDQARTHYNTGVELMKANNFANALSEFEQASTVDASKHAAMKMLSYRANASLAEAHYQIGVDLFNKKQRPEAKTHFDAAVASVQKAIAVAVDDTAENNPTLNADLIVYYNILAKNVMLLVEYYGPTDANGEKARNTLIDETVKQFEKVQTLDAPNTNKWEVMKADMYRSSGRTEQAVATYKKVLTADPNYADALYGLGLTLIASSERAQIQEGANTLADFLAKAPATDKRVPIVKSSLEELKNGLKIEAEKPAAPGRRRKP